MQVKEYALYKGEELLAMGLSVKLLNNWVCQLAPLVTTAHRYTLVEPVKTEGD